MITSGRSAILASSFRKEAADVTDVDVMGDDSSFTSLFFGFVCSLFRGTSNDSSGRQFCSRTFSSISRRSLNSVEHTARSQRSGITLLGAHRSNFSLSSRGGKYSKNTLQFRFVTVINTP